LTGNPAATVCKSTVIRIDGAGLSPRCHASVGSARPNSRHAGATGASRKQTERPSILHTSLYLPEPVYEALRKIAFEERLKIHDVVLEGIDLALRRRRYTSIDSLKAGKKR
jgi:hypothetical protein